MVDEPVPARRFPASAADRRRRRWRRRSRHSGRAGRGGAGSAAGLTRMASRSLEPPARPALAAQQARPDDVEPVEAQRRQRRLHLAFDSQCRRIARPDRRRPRRRRSCADTPAARAAPAKATTMIEIDRPEGYRPSLRRAPSCLSARHSPRRRNLASERRPAIGRRRHARAIADRCGRPGGGAAHEPRPRLSSSRSASRRPIRPAFRR